MYTAGKTYAQDSIRATTLFVHAATPLDVMNGVSTPLIELTRFATSVKQGPAEVSLGLAWHDELYGASQPKAGQVLEIKLEGDSYWIGVIQAVNDYRLSSGTRSMSIVARSRDATPAWRDVKRATDLYPTATPLAYIARQIAQAVGLTSTEILLPEAGASTVHSNTQLADLSPWTMLTTLYQPGGLEPYVDCRGRLKCISRDIARASDIVMTDNRRLIEVSGSKSRAALTEMRVKWLDPHLTESAQQDRMLDRASITAGFFQINQERDVFFSPDQTQRARDTHMVIKQSANSGLLPVCDESYEQLTTTKGKITLDTTFWVPLLATGAIATKFIAHNMFDGVTGTVTVPVGRRLEFYADIVLFLTMMSIGTGQYEIWGTPFDYVHARNTTTAYNPAASPWEIMPQEIENDFVMDEPQAQSFAIRELIYNHRSASAYNVSIVDDTRIERGDIVELVDGSRVYVTDYTRDLGLGAPAVLQIQGFRADSSAIIAGGSINASGSVGTIPANTSAPVISGATPAGSTLTAAPGTWIGTPTPTISGQWYADGYAISGQTGATYVTVTGDVGKAIAYLESASSTAGTAIALSNAITVT